MKITKTLRVFLILLSVMMVLPLFACGDTPEETTTKAPEQTTAPKEETTTDKKVETTEPKADATTAEPEAPATTVAPEETTEAETTSAETTEATTESGSETTETGSESSETETTEVETTETAEATEAPECEHVEEAIPAVAPTCTETGLTEGKKCSVCGEILVAQQTVDALGHTEETVASKAATCTETGLTEGKKCSVCDEILVAQETVDALGHTEEVVPGKAATCTEDGLTDGKKCSVCNTELVAQQTIPAGHTEETVAGKAATCTEAGLTDGKKCSVCGEILVAQNEIPATNHANKTDKAFMAPTTAEAGWEAHTICPDCGKVWDAKGEELEAVPTIEKIVPATNVYLGVEELKDKVVSGNPVDGNPSQFNAPEVSADRTYVRFSRAGASDDGNIMLLAGNTEATGQYFVMKYRTDHRTNFQFWANTKDNGHDGGKANFYSPSANDAKWHIIVLDLSKSLSTYVVADGDGKYTIQWSRIDLLDGKASAGYFDIAFAAYCDDLSEISSVLLDGDEEFCSHIISENPEFTNCGENHSAECILCGGNKYFDHSISGVPTWNVETKKYSGSCACGYTVESDMLFVSEAYYASGASGVTATRNDAEGVTRYTITNVKDAYFHVYAEGSAVTGKYAVVKYRAVNGGKNATFGNHFAASVMDPDGHSFATSGDDQNGAGLGTIYADGEWHYVVVPSNSKHFVANADGTYSHKFLRLGIGNETMATDGSAYIEVDWVAFADNKYAVDRYVYGDDAVCAHEKTTKEFVTETDTLVITCLHCGHVTETTCPHNALSAATWDSEAKVYKATCADCGKTVTSDVFYRSEAITKAEDVEASGNFLKIEQMDGFVRYTAIASQGDPYFYPIRSNTHVTGNIMAIKYKITNNGTDMTTGSLFASTTASGQSKAAGKNGDNTNYAVPGYTLYADGEWHYIFINPNLDVNTTFKPNTDGTYTWAYLRMNLNGFAAFDGSCYIDIDEIAFFDNAEAATNYLVKNDPEKAIKFTVNLDGSLNTLNGDPLFEKTPQQQTTVVVDMADKTLDTPASIKIGGWFCTTGGVASYKVRVTKVNGEAVAEPELVDWVTPLDRTDIYNAYGNSNGFLADCAYGAGMDGGTAVDLTAYAGKTVEFEIVALTNLGGEIVAVRATNVKVPSAQ